MKKLSVLLVLLLVFFFVACGDDDTRDTSAYAGDYAGTYFGPVSGDWVGTVTSDGSISGYLDYETPDEDQFSGDMYEDGTFTAISGGGVALGGTITEDVVLGDWDHAESSTSGTFAGGLILP